MKNDLKQPCNECPFRKNSLPGYLGGFTPEETYQGVMTHEEDFACHLTRHKPVKEMSRCRGSLLFLKKNGKMPKYNTKLAEELRKMGKPDTSNILSNFEFMSHHT